LSGPGLRKVRLKSSGNTVAEYTYDCHNRRFRKVVTNGGKDGTQSNGTTEYYYEGWQVIEEQDGSGNVLRQYVYGNYIDEPWVLDDRTGGTTVADLNDGSGSDRHFYHCNTQYSIHALTDETGSIAEGYVYDAYGRQTVFTAAGSDAAWFTSDDTIAVNGDSAVANVIFPPEIGHPVKVVGRSGQDGGMMAACQREGGTRVVPGPSAQLVA